MIGNKLASFLHSTLLLRTLLLCSALLFLFAPSYGQGVLSSTITQFSPEGLPTGANSHSMPISYGSPGGSIFKYDGVTSSSANSTLHILNIYTIIYYVPTDNGTLIFTPPSVDSQSVSYYYVAIRVKFDSSSWTSLPANSGIGLQWINAKYQSPLTSATTLEVDNFYTHSDSAYTLFNTPHPLTPSTVGYLWFPFSQAQTKSATNPSANQGFDYTDANSAYYIFRVKQLAPGPFNAWPYTSFTTPYNYGAGLWAFNNPSANGLCTGPVNMKFSAYLW